MLIRERGDELILTLLHLRILHLRAERTAMKMEREPSEETIAAYDRAEAQLDEALAAAERLQQNG